MADETMTSILIFVSCFVFGSYAVSSLENRQLSGSGTLNLGSVGNVGVNVQNGQVSGSASLNLPGGSNVNVGVDSSGQVSGSGTVQLPGGSSVSGSLQNGQLSGSANVNLPGGSNVNVGVDPNGQVSGSGTLQLPGGSSVSGSLQNGQLSGSANVNLPGGSSVNANLQNGQLSGGANINMGGTQANLNLQNGQLSGGLSLPGGGSSNTGGGGIGAGTGYNPDTFTGQANINQFLSQMGNLNFKPGSMDGQSGVFSPGQMPSMGSGGFNMGSGSGGFNMGSGSGGFNMGSGSGGFNMGTGGSGSGSGSGGFGSFGSGSGGFGSGSGSSGFGSGSGSGGLGSFGSGSFGSGGSSSGSGSGGFGSFGSGGFGTGSTGTGSSGAGTNTGTGTGGTGSGSGSLSGNTGSGTPSGMSNTGGTSGQTSAGGSTCSPSAGISSQNPPSGSCLCVTASNVIVHATGSLSGQKIGTLSSPKCVTYTGSKITPCLHDPNTQDKHAWFKISLGGQTAWMAGDYLSVGDKSKCPSTSTSSGSGGSTSGGSSTGSSSGSVPHASSGSASNCFPGSEMNSLQQTLIQYEKLVNTAYDAQPKSSYVDWTVCVGFNLKRSNARQVFAQALPGVNFDAVYKGQALSDAQCMALFAYDLEQNYISQPKSRFGAATFCKFPLNVKIAIVSAYYRGDMGPKTQGLIAAGDWCNVRKEYLNHGDYINCHSRGIPGVCNRMDWNAQQFQTMCHAGTSSQTSSSTSGGSTGSGACSPVAKEYACKVLQLHNQGKISLWDAHSSKQPDQAYAINNVRDTCNGLPAHRSSYRCNECPTGPAPGGTVCINPTILKYIYDLGTRGTEKVLINEIAGACHSCTSKHYYGNAVDIQTSSTRNRDYMDTCRKFGGVPLDEVASASHIHCTITV